MASSYVITALDKWGKPHELVKVQKDGCTGCVGDLFNAEFDCGSLPDCGMDGPSGIGYIFVPCTEENVTRAVISRMENA